VVEAVAICVGLDFADYVLENMPFGVKFPELERPVGNFV
jgi:hypothetical protein